MLASLLFPYDDDAFLGIEGWLSELDNELCIIRYAIDGDSYIQILNWLKHQKIDKPSPSKIPEFDESSRIFSKPREVSSEDQGSRKGSKDQGRDQGMEPTDTVASLPSPSGDSNIGLFPLPEEKPKAKRPSRRNHQFGIAELDMPPAMASAWERVKKAYPKIGLNTQTNRTAPRMTNPAKAGKWFKLICEECPVELGEGQRITPDDLADATLAWIKKKQKEAPGGNVPVVPCIENYFSCDPVAKLHWQSALLEYFGTSEAS
jgi:hypothetical protein